MIQNGGGGKEGGGGQMEGERMEEGLDDTEKKKNPMLCTPRACGEIYLMGAHIPCDEIHLTRDDRSSNHCSRFTSWSGDSERLALTKRYHFCLCTPNGFGRAHRYHAVVVVVSPPAPRSPPPAPPVLDEGERAKILPLRPPGLLNEL